MIDEGDFGPVKVIAGRHKGKVGYYDDDDTERSAIVYFGVPFVEPPTIIPRRFLESTAAEHLPSARLPGFVRERMGVVQRRDAR
jgi:hypothetical protein